MGMGGFSAICTTVSPSSSLCRKIGSSENRASPNLRSQVYERKLGLARFSEEPIFLHRDEDGETVVQMAEKPPMPIRYLLDLDASKALKDIASQATLDFGGEWMILAEEDEEGRLVITRLG